MAASLPPADPGRRRALRALGAAALAAAPAARVSSTGPATDGGPFVATPWIVVDEMIKLADITAADTVFDLGSGDGRLVIAAAKRHGARAVGIERDENLVIRSRSQAQTDGVAERVRFVQGDVLAADLRGATVVTLYLLPRLVAQLVPKLRAELPAGARIVSHDYALGPWRPDKTLLFDVEEKLLINGMVETRLFYYVVPARVAGRWTLELPEELARAPGALTIEQSPDRLAATARLDGRDATVRELSLRADAIRFELLHDGRLVALEGRVAGATMAGEVRARGVRGTWWARKG